jgi:hypothetical protein
MATNTRGSACRAQGERGETESQGRTKDTNSRSCIISKAAVLYSNKDKSLSALCFYAYKAKLNKDKKIALNIDFTTKKDKLEYYISLV